MDFIITLNLSSEEYGRILSAATKSNTGLEEYVKTAVLEKTLKKENIPDKTITPMDKHELIKELRI